MSTENFKVKVVNGDSNKVPSNFNNLTLKKLLKWIDDKVSDPRIKEELKKSASRYPHNALERWKEQFNKHLATAQKKLRPNTILNSEKSKNVKEEIEDVSLDELQLPADQENEEYLDYEDIMPLMGDEEQEF